MSLAGENGSAHAQDRCIARITLLGLVVIVGGTLFPYNFSPNSFVSLTNNFELVNAIGRRGNDLLIGVDGKFLQPFKGKRPVNAGKRLPRLPTSTERPPGTTYKG